MIFLTSVHDIAPGSNFDATMRKRDPHTPHPAWGITELSFATFERVAKNDHVMFYHKGMVTGMGKVRKTMVDEALSVRLWGSYQHRFKGTLHWSGIILFSEYHDLAMPFKEVIDLGAYDPKYAIRRIIQLNEVGCAAIQRAYGTEEEYVAHVLASYGTKQSATLSKAGTKPKPAQK